MLGRRLPGSLKIQLPQVHYTSESTRGKKARRLPETLARTWAVTRQASRLPRAPACRVSPDQGHTEPFPGVNSRQEVRGGELEMGVGSGCC